MDFSGPGGSGGVGTGSPSAIPDFGIYRTGEGLVRWFEGVRIQGFVL